MTKLFFSHASKDADAIMDFSLRVISEMNLQNGDFIHTSIRSAGFANGAEFNKAMKQHIEEAAMVIFFISKSFKESQNCMNELAWREGKPAFYFLLAGHDFDVLPVLLHGRCVEKFDEAGMQKCLDMLKAGQTAPDQLELCQKINEELWKTGKTFVGYRRQPKPKGGIMPLGLPPDTPWNRFWRKH